MLRRLTPFAFALTVAVAACSGVEPLATNGFEERIVDRDIRHGQGMRIVDLDGDGNLDMVAALSLTDAVHVYLRKDPADPELKDWDRVSISGPSRIVAMDVAVGDLDGDGDLDVAAVGLFQREIGLNSPGDVVWYENPGNPRGVWTTHEVATPRLSDDGSRYVGGAYGARAVRLADLDADGDLDMVVGALESVAVRFDLLPDGTCGQLPALGNGVHWFANRGDGVFDGPATIDPAINGVGAMATADVDADGRIDVIATGSLSQSVVWYRNVADAAGPRFVRRALVTLGGTYYGLDVANLDGDAPLEIVTAVTRPNGGYVHVFDPPADLTANPGALWTTSTVTAGIGSVACTVNDDCERAGDRCATVQVCTGTVAEPATPCDPAEQCNNGEDDNGDGLVDCDDPTCGVNPACAECTESQQCANNPPGQLEPLECTEDEQCPRVVDICTDGFCPAVIQNPIVKLADFSGDGRPDLMVAEANGLLQRYYRLAEGGWERRDIRRGHPGITYLEAGDVDGDGRVDLITSTYEFGTRDRISWWLNQGN